MIVLSVIMCLLLQVHSYGQLSFQNNAGECSRNPIYDTLIVPFWQCHQDNRNSNSQILYRFSEDITILNKVGTIISDAYQVSFSPAVLFIATWNKVPHYGGPNTVVSIESCLFQTVITTCLLVLLLLGKHLSSSHSY